MAETIEAGKAASRPTRWLGQDVGAHNQYVLGKLLGFTGAEITRLEADGV